MSYFLGVSPRLGMCVVLEQSLETFLSEKMIISMDVFLKATLAIYDTY
jgi:hypothetical protein